MNESKIELSSLNIDEIITDLANTNVNTAVTFLQRKDIYIPSWQELEKQYNKDKHLINDRGFRKDKKKDGDIYNVSRIAIGLQKLACERMAELMFSIPIKRKYIYPKDVNENIYKDITNAIETIYKKVRIDALNIERSENLFASCEIATVLYLKEEENNKYGFNSKYKVQLKTYTPKNNDKLFPIFDDYGDMIAFSIEYKRKLLYNGVLTEQTHFDTYTANYIYNFIQGTENEVTIKPNPIGKIPIAYCFRNEPIYADVCGRKGDIGLIDEIEMAISDNSDVNRINSAPILAGKGLNPSGDTGGILRFYDMGENGDLKYVTWQQATENVKFQIEEMLKLFFQQLQLPDLSFENLKALNLQSGEAMKMLLTDSHLKVGHESGRFIEMFDREASIIKSVLKLMNVQWANYIDNIEIEHEITPFVPNDENATLTNLQKATGGKAVMSQREGIEKFGYSDDIEKTLQEIQNEEKQTAINNNSGMIFE